MIVEIVEIGIMKSNEIRKGGFNLKATVLVDNIGTEIATGEWGLSIYIEQAGKNILLDTGASNRFLVNAKALEKDIGQWIMGYCPMPIMTMQMGCRHFLKKMRMRNFIFKREPVKTVILRSGLFINILEFQNIS